CNGSHPELLNTLLEWDDVTDPRASQAFKDQVAECTTRWDKDNIPYAHASFGLRNRCSGSTRGCSRSPASSSPARAWCSARRPWC
ncbi:hypothetical protein ACS2Q5_34895, partial [Bacillus cereus group sp. Bce022]